MTDHRQQPPKYVMRPDDPTYTIEGRGLIKGPMYWDHVMRHMMGGHGSIHSIACGGNAVTIKRASTCQHAWQEYSMQDEWFARCTVCDIGAPEGLAHAFAQFKDTGGDDPLPGNPSWPNPKHVRGHAINDCISLVMAVRRDGGTLDDALSVMRELWVETT